MDEILDNWMFDEQEKKHLRFYKDFVSLEEAKAFTDILNANNIPYSAEVPKMIADQTFVGTGMLPKAIIKLLPQDFKKVNALIANQLAGATFADVQDHYLNQFNDDELMAVFEKPDEWSVEDTQVAKIILRERGVAVSDDAIQKLRETRLQEIRQGRKGNRVWMAFYFLSIILILVLHPIFFIAGVGMGYYYGYGRSVDQDGNKHYVYEPETRFYGKIILYGGLLVLVVEVLILWGVL